MSCKPAAPAARDVPRNPHYQITLGGISRFMTIAEILQETTVHDAPVAVPRPRETATGIMAVLLEVASAQQQRLIQRLLEQPAISAPGITIEDVLARIKEIKEEC